MERCAKKSDKCQRKRAESEERETDERYDSSDSSAEKKYPDYCRTMTVTGRCIMGRGVYWKIIPTVLFLV